MTSRLKGVKQVFRTIYFITMWLTQMPDISHYYQEPSNRRRATQVNSNLHRYFYVLRLRMIHEAVSTYMHTQGVCLPYTHSNGNDTDIRPHFALKHCKKVWAKQAITRNIGRLSHRLTWNRGTKRARCVLCVREITFYFGKGYSSVYTTVKATNPKQVKITLAWTSSVFNGSKNDMGKNKPPQHDCNRAEECQ